MDVYSKKQKNKSLTTLDTSIGHITVYRVNGLNMPGAEVVIEAAQPIPENKIKKILFEADLPFEAIIILHKTNNQSRYAIRLASSNEVDNANN